MKTKFLFPAIILLSVVCQTAAAEEEIKNHYSVGATFLPEWSDGSGMFTPNFGALLEAQFNHHSGVEFGVFSRQYYAPVTTTMKSMGVTDSPYYRFLSFRMGYKRFGDFLNFSTGFNIETPISSSASEKGEVGFGLYFSLSKDIPLYKGLILEPEAHFNPFVNGVYESYIDSYFGFGLTLKYRF